MVIVKLHISRGQWGICQLSGFWGVGAIVASFVPTECPKGGGMWGIFGKPLKRAIWNTPGLHAVLTTCLRFSSVLDNACVVCCLFLSTGSCHVFIQIHATGSCFPGRTTKAFGAQKGSLWGYKVPHPGYVRLKSGYSETIPWRKVGLIKQRNVDLTTDGLWAMPLNEGWVPVKARRLQDWQKLKKYVPVHKQVDVCPNGVPALPEKRNADDDSDSE